MLTYELPKSANSNYLKIAFKECTDQWIGLYMYDFWDNAQYSKINAVLFWVMHSIHTKKPSFLLLTDWMHFFKNSNLFLKDYLNYCYEWTKLSIFNLCINITLSLYAFQPNPIPNI